MSLVLSGVRLIYPDGDRELVALADVDLAVEAGEFAAVAGPSGSGKSSLLAVAATLITPQAGTVRVAGIDAGPLAGRERARLRRDRIGIVFQQPNLLPSLTAIEQLLVMDHVRGRSPDRDRARALLAEVGLADLADRRPHRLSGGERQRVGIARALTGDPALLLADEPTSALDERRGAQVIELLCGLTRRHGLATVMVTHDTRHLAAADHILTMSDGVLAVGGQPGGSSCRGVRRG